ncbi:unnamed protein product [Linum tenue]|nr:unnamed protein product [Linum tenue]
MESRSTASSSLH